jgi:hypothetical protein
MSTPSESHARPAGSVSNTRAEAVSIALRLEGGAATDHLLRTPRWDLRHARVLKLPV